MLGFLLFADEGQLFALHPSVVACGVIVEPEDEIKVLGCAFYIKEVFFKVLEPDWR